MTTSQAINPAELQDVWSLRNPNEFPFLRKFTEEMKANHAYEGMKILHNIPLSLETVIKLESLITAGADVTVIPFKWIKPHSQPMAEKILKQAGVRIEQEAPHDEIFDFHFDCCAELSKLPTPRLGVVELTQTGSEIYQQLNLPVPVISVDDSNLKALETFYGTGGGFVQAFETLTQKIVSENNFLVFGFGKVGQGVANSLFKKGATPTVVDISNSKLALAKSRGFSVVNGKNKAELQKAIESASAIVTATGIEGFMSKIFGSSELFKGKILSNIGAQDEFGDLFDGQVLNNRVPINFALDSPTENYYLDPIFYAHNIAPMLIQEFDLKAGYNPFPHKKDMEILEYWSKIHNESIDMILPNIK